MGRKRFSAFRTKKGTPLYSKEDIREQYCITNKQLHVLETAQASKLFGCIPNQDWKSCHRASLLSSCLRKTKSASDENLAGIRTDTKPLAWEAIPPEMQGPCPKAVSLASSPNIPSSVGAGEDKDVRRDLENLDHHPLLQGHPPAIQSSFQLQATPQPPRTFRQSFDEELANAVLRRKAKLVEGADGEEEEYENDGSRGPEDVKRHTWADEAAPTRSRPRSNHLPSSSSDGNLLARHSTTRPTLLRLRSQDSGGASDGISGGAGIHGDGQDGSKRYSKTLPNTPDLSHSSARRQPKTPDMSLDDRRQKHVSFDSAALLRSHPTISTMDDAQMKILTSSPSTMKRMSSKASPDRKSQERLLDIGSSKKSGEQLQQQLGKRAAIRSLDLVSGLSPKVQQTLLLAKLRKAMKTQATQTEITVTERISIPAPVLAYLTLSPRAHTPDIPVQGKVYNNGKRLVKSRSDSEYKIKDDSDMKMTVVHLDDSVILGKRRANRSKSSPLAHRHVAQREIMVVFKPQDRKNNGGHYVTHHHKLLKTFSEGSVLNRQHLTKHVPTSSQEVNQELPDPPMPPEEEEEPKRERSESDPLFLETDMDDQSGIPKLREKNGEPRQRSRSVAQTQSEKEEAMLRTSEVTAQSSVSTSTSTSSSSSSSTSSSSTSSSSSTRDATANFGKQKAEVESDQSRCDPVTQSRQSPKSQIVGTESHSQDLTDHSLSTPPSSWTTPSGKYQVLSEERSSKLETGDGGESSSEKHQTSISSDQARKVEPTLEAGDRGLSTSERSLAVGSSGDIEKTVTYSSDTEFSSIKSEDSHTLMMDQEEDDNEMGTKTSKKSPSSGTEEKSDDALLLTADPSASSSRSSISGTKPLKVEKKLLIPKEYLGSPESESSGSCYFTEKESIRGDQSPLSLTSLARPKSNLSYTDSNKSEQEYSETSEDYHTATEHSNTDTFEMWATGYRNVASGGGGVGTAASISKQSGRSLPSPLHSLSHRTSLSSSRDDIPEADTSHEGTEDVTIITEIHVLDNLHNLPSPRSPHASSLSIESSTSGSYTLESGHSDRDSTRKHSTSTLSDSDKELENIFSSKPEGGFIGQQRDTLGDGESPDEDEDHNVTPTPEAPSTTINVESSRLDISHKRSSKEGEILARRMSKTDSTSEDVTDKSINDDATSKPGDVVESSYNFAEIRLKFERMLDKDKQTSSRDRSSSVETEGTSSSVSDNKPPIRKKPEILSVKPTCHTVESSSAVSKTDKAALTRPTGFGQHLDRDSLVKKAEDDKRCLTTAISDKSRHRVLTSGSVDKDFTDSHRKEYRRSVSESPEASSRHLSWEIPRSASEIQVEGSYTSGSGGGGSGGGARSKRGFVEGMDRPKNGKKHKTRGQQDKDHGHPKHRDNQSSDELSDARRSVSESPDRWSGARGGVYSLTTSRDDMLDGHVARRSQHQDAYHRHRCKKEDSPVSSSAAIKGAGGGGSDRDLSGMKKSSSSRTPERDSMAKDEPVILYADTKWSSPLSKGMDTWMTLSEAKAHQSMEKKRSGGRWSQERSDHHTESRMQEATWIGGKDVAVLKPKSDDRSRSVTSDSDLTLISAADESKSAKPLSGQSSTESLLRRSPGDTSLTVDSPGQSSSLTSSLAESSQYASTHDIGQEEEDEDVGVYAESYRASAWIYIGDNEELMVWQGRPISGTSGGSDKLEDESAVVAASGAMASGVPALAPSVDPSLHRTDSLESTASEKEFRRRYQAITHRMVHRKSSVEMYKRLSNRTFDCDKTVTVSRKSGEFGFRIHGSRPVVVSAIEPGTPAESSGLEVGDIVIAVNGVNVLDASHSEVVKIAHAGADTLKLDVARTCHILTPVVSDMESQRPVHSGFLYKLAGGSSLVKKWCKRWFVVKKDHCLYYYKNESSKEPLGAIMLLNYSVNRANDVGRPFAFRVAKYGSASYCFAAEDEDSMNNWASVINQIANTAGQADPWIEVSSRNVQLPALSIHNPDCHGYLAKLGQRWRTWRRRYCVLKDACIYFYHDMNSVTSLGVAHLHGYKVQSCSITGKKFAFEAIPPEIKMRHFYFYADNDTDRKRWLASMEYSIDRWIKVG